jgi:hypothetical protein
MEQKAIARAIRPLLLAAVVLSVVALGGSVAAAPAPGAADAGSRPVPLGVSYSGWNGGFADAETRLATFKGVGFSIVTFVPAYAYVGRNRVDLATGPGAEEMGRAVEAALRMGLSVVMKPHLEPLLHRPGYNRAQSDNHSWRAECGWRGFFDVDPMTADYREGVVFANLRMLKTVFDRMGADAHRLPPVRFELGAELMNSIVDSPTNWQRLLEAARKERRRLGLDARVALSHNFSHHIEIPEDEIDRMTREGRRALGRYIAGLDAVALSQYMDLTIAVPAAERQGPTARMPTADEVAEALRLHERNFRSNILEGALGLKPKEIPPLHVGEFGVGSGGLRHPNLWGGSRTPEQERALLREIARGHEGLVRYLTSPAGRTAQSAVLWVSGPHYDIFGWRNPAWAIPDAAAAIRAALAGPAQEKK